MLMLLASIDHGVTRTGVIALKVTTVSNSDMRTRTQAVITVKLVIN